MTAHLASAERLIRRARTATTLDERIAHARLAAAHLAALLCEHDERDDGIAAALAASIVVAKRDGGRAVFALIEGGRR